MEKVFPDNVLFARWVRGDISDAERQRLEQHPDFPVFRRLMENAQQQQLSENDSQVLWNRYFSSRQRRRPIRKFHWLWWLVGILGLASLALFSWTVSQTVSSTPSISATTTGEQRTVELPDGSTVRLNAVSSIDVYTRNWASKRRVRLIGEAFFQIKKGMAPFVVETSAGSVTVLGTSFNVRYRGTGFEVACYTGFVQASTPNGNKQALRAGQKTLCKNERWQQLAALNDPWPAWMQGESRFGDAPVYEVFAELERQYNISISASGTEGRRFSGLFIHKDLPQALRMVCEPLGLQYEIAGKQVLIRRKS